MTIYRMHRAARSPADFTGAMLAGGRWNPIGTPMLYAAEHLSLSCLEVLVHLEKSQLPSDYVWSRAELLDVLELGPAPDLASVGACQAAGSAWINLGQLATRVPSFVIPEEFNVLLNPRHPRYTTLLWSEPRPFHFDPRLFVTQPELL